MSNKKKVGRKPKLGGKRTSILIEGPTFVALRIMAEKEKRSRGEIVDRAVEEYYMNHYETELMERVNAHDDQT
jgi:predicted DNA-binding ribbon-helix-helix protein